MRYCKHVNLFLAINEIFRRDRESVPQLQELSEELVEIFVNSDAPREQISIAAEQEMLLQRINNNVNQVLEGGQETAACNRSIQSGCQSLWTGIDWVVEWR